MIDLIPAPSPNFDTRRAPPDMLVLHYTGMETGEAALARLRDPEAKVSAHYLVEEDGRIFQLVPEERRAWHAGAGGWRGEDDCNAASIGIEIVNPGHEFGYRLFPEAQIAAVIALIGDIRDRWTIPDNRIIAHSDLAPARKTDPGELFPVETPGRGGPRPLVRARRRPDQGPGRPVAEGRPGDRGRGPARRPAPAGLWADARRRL
jgi:N-acetylmuramoyl-L-alanine amidase